MRSDDHVDAAVGETLDRFLGLAVGLESAERSQVHGESGEALDERLHVLLHEQRRRHDHGDLLAILNRFECGANGNLGLAVTHVAGEQAIHRDGRLHVALDLIDRGQLVRRLDERERLLEFLLPGSIGREGVTAGGHPSGVELDEFDRDVTNRATRLALRGSPVAAAHLAEGWRLAADIAGEQVELVGRYVELVARDSRACWAHTR